MLIMRNLQILATIVFIAIFSISNAKSAEECFENTSRAVFKFNMALMILF